MQKPYMIALAKLPHLSGLKRVLRRESKLKADKRLPNINLFYDLNPSKPYDYLKPFLELHPEPNYLNPKHINLTNMNGPLLVIKKIEARCLPSCSQI